MFESYGQGVVERGQAGWLEPDKRCAKLTQVVRECDRCGQAQKDFFVKIYDEDFVVGIARADECESAVDDLRILVSHTAALVDDEPDACRDILGFEKFDVLKAVVFI